MENTFLGSNYILTHSNNFDAYMKALGVGLTLRKMGNTVTTQCLLECDKDDIYTFTLTSPFRCVSTYFRLGREFKEITLDNREVNTVFELEGNVLTQKQYGYGTKDTTIVREYNDTVLLTTLSVGDVTAARIYQKV